MRVGIELWSIERVDTICSGMKVSAGDGVPNGVSGIA